MFTEVRPGVLRSSEGFEVADLGIKHLVYREGDHVMRLDKDVGMKRIRYYIREIPSWDEPHGTELVTAQHAAQIRRRILAALVYWKDPFDTDLG